MNHYQILCVSRDASQIDIKKAYKRMVFKMHPDRNSNYSKEQFFQLKKAYDVLSDPIKRRKYNQTLWPVRPLMDILKKFERSYK